MSTPASTAPMTSFLGDLFTGEEETDVALEVETPQPKPAVPVPGASETPAPSAPKTAVAAAATKTPVQASEPAKPKHPAWLLAQAESFGLHPLMIERLDTDTLGAVVTDEMKKARTRTQASPDSGQLPGQTAAPAQAAPPAVPAFDWGEHEDFEYDFDGKKVSKGKRKFTDDDVHPAIAAVIKKQSKEIEDLKAFVGTMATQARSATESRKEQAFNAAFDKFPSFLGKGSPQSLHGKPEFERRRILYQAVDGMMKAMPAEVRATMSLDSAVQSMAKSIFNVEPEVAAAASETPVQPSKRQPGTNGHASAQDWVNGAVAVPTQRTPNPAGPGRTKAVEAATDWFNEARTTEPDGGLTSIDEFLG